MEAILSYVQILVAVIRQAEQISLSRHCGMEGCIKYNNLRCTLGEYLLAGSQCQCVRVVMYGCKLSKTVDLVNDLVSYHAGLLEYLSTLHYSVTDSCDLGHRVDNLCITCGEHLNELFKGLSVGREIAVSLKLSAVTCLCAYVTVNAYSVSVALCDNALISHIKKLILQRGRACVYNKNFHIGNILLSDYLTCPLDLTDKMSYTISITVNLHNFKTF